MRELTQDEMHTVLQKLAEYIGPQLNRVFETILFGAERNVFRLNQQRVFLVRESVAKLATSISRDNLLSLGTCLGRFTKTGRFRLHISALPLLAEHAQYRIHIRPNAEMAFLYGGHILLAHVARWPQDCPAQQGLVICSPNGNALGFGIMARSASEAKRLDPTGIVCFRQADCGEFLRDEDNLFAS